MLVILCLEDMFECRKKACEEFNNRYGTNMKVDKSEELKEMEVAVNEERNTAGTLQKVQE